MTEEQSKVVPGGRDYRCSGSSVLTVRAVAERTRVTPSDISSICDAHLGNFTNVQLGRVPGTGWTER